MTGNETMKRRDFLKTAGSGITALTASSFRTVRGANDRIRVGLIGCGGRGSVDARLMRGTAEDIRAIAPEYIQNGELLPRFKAPPNVEIAALCDVYGSRMDSARKWAPQAKTYKDFRSLLDDGEIDAVIIATPDPWHAAMLILACEAGVSWFKSKWARH